MESKGVYGDFTIIGIATIYSTNKKRIKMTIDKIISMFQENIIAFFSLAVASLTLWLVHLRGPSISLLEKPSIEWKKKDQEQGIIPYNTSRLGLGGTLIFFNSGNRAGLVQNVSAEWAQDREYKEFFEFNQYSIGYGTNTEQRPGSTPKYLIIREKSVDKIMIDGYMSVDNIIFNSLEHKENWNLDIEHEDLKTLIEESFAYKKRKLDEFVTLIESKNPGNLKISYEYTGKKMFIRDTLKSKSFRVNMSQIPSTTIDMYKDLQEEWETEKPATTKVMNRLSRTIERYYTALNENKKSLELEIEKGSLNSIGNWGLPHEEWGYHILKRWTKYKDVMNKTVEIHRKMAEFNELVGEYQGGIQRRDLEDFGKNILEEINEVLPELENAKKYLKNILRNREN